MLVSWLATAKSFLRRQRPLLSPLSVRSCLKFTWTNQVPLLTPNSCVLTGKAKTKEARQTIINPDWNFEKMGIGGLDKEFSDIFRRAFASRVFPPDIVEQMGKTLPCYFFCSLLHQLEQRLPTLVLREQRQPFFQSSSVQTAFDDCQSQTSAEFNDVSLNQVCLSWEAWKSCRTDLPYKHALKTLTQQSICTSQMKNVLLHWAQKPSYQRLRARHMWFREHAFRIRCTADKQRAAGRSFFVFVCVC